METKHTPGPWTVEDWNYKEPGREHVPIIRTCADAIAEVLPLWNASKDRQDERIANAHLIAAAPQLLAALENMIAKWEYCGWSGDKHNEKCVCVICQARAALAKAKGE